MTFLRRRETFRISPRGKGSESRGGGGGGINTRRCIKNGSNIPSAEKCDPSGVISGCTTSPRLVQFLTGTSDGQAACMIIEHHPPLPTTPRQNPHQDSTQRLLSHLVLPKHRTSKFHSNRHRKLQPFRET